MQLRSTRASPSPLSSKWNNARPAPAIRKNELNRSHRYLIHRDLQHDKAGRGYILRNNHHAPNRVRCIQYARSRQQLMSRRHALRCPQTELTPHKLHTALLTHLAEVDLPCVAEFQEMFASANANPGPIWITDIAPHQTKVRQQLQHLYPDQELSWREATVDEHQVDAPLSDPAMSGNRTPDHALWGLYRTRHRASTAPLVTPTAWHSDLP